MKIACTTCLAAVLGGFAVQALGFNPQPDPPAGLSYLSFDVNGSVETFGNGINGKGVIAGYGDDGITLAHGYTLAGGALASWDAPGAVRITEHYGINYQGALSGAYYDGTSLVGYLLQGNSFTRLDPGGPYTVAWGLNDANRVVGSYDVAGVEHGFSWNGAAFTDLLVPGSLSTQARDIDNNGRIVGWSVDGARFQHGFQRVGNNYTVFDVPGDLSYGTRVMGTNDHGWLVGAYGDAIGRHGFINSGSSTWRIDIPGALWTEVRGISDQLVMVGAWGDANGVGVHGFSATMLAAPVPVPEPQTWLLLGAGLLLLALRRRRRLLAPLACLAALATSGTHAASDHWVQAFVDARGGGLTQQQDSGQVDGPQASAGPLGFHVADAFGSFDSNITGNAAYGHLWGQASAAQTSPVFPRQSDANADSVAFQDRLTLTSASLAPGSFVPLQVTMVLTDKLSAGPTTCCANVIVNGRHGFSGFNAGDQAGAGQVIDHQITRVFDLLWAIGAPHDIGAILFYDVGSSPGINDISGSSRVDLADARFTLQLPSGVGQIAASGHDYTAAVPEPAAGTLMALSLAGLLALRCLGKRRGAALLAGGLLAASAQAAVVFDGGPPLHNGGFYADSSALWTRTATRATLASSTSFDGFDWWGVYFDHMGGLPEPAPGIDHFRLRIYGAGNGQPGALLHSQDLGAGSRSLLGQYLPGNNPDYAYSAAFNAVTLAAGDYYFSLADDDGVAASAWAWETRINLFGGQGVASSQDDGATWDTSDTGSSLAFALTHSAAGGTAPEPSTTALLAAAALGWAGLARRRAHAGRHLAPSTWRSS